MATIALRHLTDQEEEQKGDEEKKEKKKKRELELERTAVAKLITGLGYAKDRRALRFRPLNASSASLIFPQSRRKNPKADRQSAS